MTAIGTADDLHGLNARIKLGDPTGDLDGLVLADGHKIYYAPAIERNYAPASRRSPSYNHAFMPLGICWHSAEEDPDQIEVTPRYFQQNMGGDRVASTHYYLDSDGDVWQMVKVGDFAYAQGTRPAADRLGSNRPSWMPPLPTSYNVFLISVEQEFHANGDASTTFYEGSPMFDSAARWAAQQHRKFQIPMRMERWVTHMGLNSGKGDPGQYWLGLKPQLFKLAEHYFNDAAAPAPKAGHVLSADDEQRLLALANELATLKADVGANTDVIARLRNALALEE